MLLALELGLVLGLELALALEPELQASEQKWALVLGLRLRRQQSHQRAELPASPSPTFRAPSQVPPSSASEWSCCWQNPCLVLVEVVEEEASLPSLPLQLDRCSRLDPTTSSHLY